MSYKANFAEIDWSIRRMNISPPYIHKSGSVGSNRAALHSPAISRDYAAYECPVTGRIIEGRAAHRENLRATDCRILERGEFEDVKKNGKRDFLDGIDRAVDKAVDEIAGTLTF
tara:strand:+ start:480 stop:821 length:342 start_codon:yes stop_codon:yes gene_type:complete